MWIEVHSTLTRHPKVFRAAKILGVSPNEVKGVLINLWLYAQEHSSDDFDLKSLGNDLLSDVFQTKKSKVSKWIRALLECGTDGESGFLEEVSGRLMIHNWEKYSRHYTAYKARKNSDLERQRRHRNPTVSRILSGECHVKVS